MPENRVLVFCAPPCINGENDPVDEDRDSNMYVTGVSISTKDFVAIVNCVTRALPETGSHIRELDSPIGGLLICIVNEFVEDIVDSDASCALTWNTYNLPLTKVFDGTVISTVNSKAEALFSPTTVDTADVEDNRDDITQPWPQFQITSHFTKDLIFAWMAIVLALFIFTILFSA